MSLNGRKDSPVENVREILATWLQPHATSGASLISLITLTTVNGFAGGAVIDKHTPSHFAPWQHTHRHIHTHTNICCQEHWQLSGHHTHTGRNAQQQEGQLLWDSTEFAVITEGPSRFTS